MSRRTDDPSETGRRDVPSRTRRRGCVAEPTAASRGRLLAWPAVALSCAGLLLVGAVLVGGTSAGRGLANSAGDREPGPGAALDGASRPADGTLAHGARAAVDSLAAGWRQHDRAAFVAAATPASSRWAETTWRALSSLRVGRLDLRYVGPAVPEPGSTAAEAALVEATWDQAGWQSSTSTRLTVGLDDSSGPGIVSIRSRPGSSMPLWASGRVHVMARAGVTVVLLPGNDRPWPASRLAAMAGTARQQVSAVLGSRLGAGRIHRPIPRPLVVVPGNDAAFGRVLGHSPDDYAGIAAVTTTVDGSVRDGAPSQVVLNPGVFDSLSPLAAQVVLTHEATHVATGAAGAGMPLWVAEGFADFVALREASLPLRLSAARALAAVRRSGAPTALPRTDDFAADQAGLARAYEQAWLAFRSLQHRHGIAAVVAFYQQVLAGRPVGAALRTTTGSGLDALTAQWRADLVRLARAPA